LRTSWVVRTGISAYGLPMFNQIKNQFNEFVLSKPRTATFDFETPLVFLENL
jgi:hypothetical protein